MNAQYGIFSGRITDNEFGESLVGSNVYVKKEMSVIMILGRHWSPATNGSD